MPSSVFIVYNRPQPDCQVPAVRVLAHFFSRGRNLFGAAEYYPFEHLVDRQVKMHKRVPDSKTLRPLTLQIEL